MNESTIELMDKRTIELMNEAIEKTGYTFKLEDAEKLHALMDIFSNLIIRECGHQCKRIEDMDRIFAHFGG